MELSKQDRQKVITALFDKMTTSSFAEGCEWRIARGLEARTNEQLITLAEQKNTWTPSCLAKVGYIEYIFGSM